MRVRLLQLDDATADLGVGLLAALPAPFRPGELVRVPGVVASCRDDRRGQVDASRLVERIEVPEKGWVVLGLLGTDLFVSALTYVFGVSELGGRRGILSWSRLDMAMGGKDSLLRRVRIEAAHELGHALGLVHCPVGSCPMHRTLWPEAVELKGLDYCPSCRTHLDAATT